MDKKLLRKEIINKRDLIPNESRKLKSQKIVSKIKDCEIYKSSKYVMMFVPFGSEVDINPLIAAALEENKHVFLPVVDKNAKLILPIEISNFNDLKRSSYGILEPDLNNYKKETLDILDLIITPGVAFDLDCFRLGYGAGYYDYFFSTINPKASKIGIGFEEQVVNSVPVQAHDVQLNSVVTDIRHIRPK